MSALFRCGHNTTTSLKLASTSATYALEATELKLDLFQFDAIQQNTVPPYCY